MTMDERIGAAVYILCFLTSAACALLLIRSYRRSRARLLLWSGVAFVALAANNLLLVIDLLLLPAMDLRVVRMALSLAALAILLFGFIWDGEE